MAKDVGAFDKVAVELTLDHVGDVKIVRTYDRGERLTERRRLAEWWADSLLAAQQGGAPLPPPAVPPSDDPNARFYSSIPTVLDEEMHNWNVPLCRWNVPGRKFEAPGLVLRDDVEAILQRDFTHGMNSRCLFLTDVLAWTSHGGQGRGLLVERVGALYECTAPAERGLVRIVSWPLRGLSNAEMSWSSPPPRRPSGLRHPPSRRGAVSFARIEEPMEVRQYDHSEWAASARESRVLHLIRGSADSPV
ncbi:MAG: hypothetical protein ACM3SX_20035 [Deltaproteobacteria bacterium]